MGWKCAQSLILFVCLFICSNNYSYRCARHSICKSKRKSWKFHEFLFLFFFLFVLCWQFIAHTKVSVWTFATATAAEENSTNHTPLKMAAHKCVLLAHSILLCVCVCVQSRVLTKRDARCVMHSENNNFSIAFIVYIVQCTNVYVFCLRTSISITYSSGSKRMCNGWLIEVMLSSPHYNISNFINFHSVLP